MAASSFPVWIGSLPEQVTESDLQELFEPFGTISSVSVMRDERGNSKHFGYVNYVKKSSAELAARNMKGRTVKSSRIKVKGPRELESNYGKSRQAAKNAPDYRPFTDCDFYISGKECNPKTGRCVYRHSENARTAMFDCPDWLQGRCLDKACPMMHTSRKLRQEREAFHAVAEGSTSESEESWKTISDEDSIDSSEEEEEVPAVQQGRGRQHRRGRRGGKRHRQRASSSTGSDKGGSVEATGEPIGVFWDIENCPVPPGKSVLACVNKIREEFFTGKREAEFICVCDISKERKEVIEQLNAAQVNVVHVSCVAKNAADDKLRQSLRRFGCTYSAPATIVLISGDVNFAPDLSDLRHRQNLTVYLLHNPQAQKALIACAHKALRFDRFTASLPSYEERDSVDLTGTKVLVKHLPAAADVKKVRNRLSRLSANCGGKVMHIDGQTALLHFTTKELAFKAQKRIDGEDVCGSKIKVRVISRSKSPGKQPVPAATVGTPPQRRSSGPPVTQANPQSFHQGLGSLPTHTLGQHPPVYPTAGYAQHQGLPVHHSYSTVPPVTRPLVAVPPVTRPLVPPTAAAPWLPHAVGTRHFRPPISIPGVKPRLPPLNPPGGVDLLVTGVPRESTKSHVRKEIQSKFGRFGKVIHVTFHPPDGSFECVYVTVESHSAASKCIASLKGTEFQGAVISVSYVPDLNKLLATTRANCYAILSELSSGCMMLRTFFEVYYQRFCHHCRFSLLDKIVDTVCLDGQSPDLTICLSSRSPRAKVKAPSLEAFLRNVIVLFQRRGTINMTSFASEYVNMFQCELPFHKDGEALEDILKSIPGINISGQLPNTQVSLDTGALQLAVSTNQPSKSGPDLSTLVQNLVLLLNSRPGGAVLYETLVGCYHQFIGSELKLKTYGFSKLGELMSAPAVSRRIQTTGTGKERVATLRHRQQLHTLKLWTLGLLKDLCRPRVLVDDFMPSYQKQFRKNLQLSDYGVTKLSELFDSLSDITQVTVEENTKYLCLRVPCYLSDVARNVEHMLKDQPEFSIELMRFQKQYELLYGQKISAPSYGFAKLSDLLTFLPDVKLQGSGTALQAVLSNAVVVFAHQARRVLEGEPGCRLQICKFAAAFHQTLRRQVKVAEYGCSKLKELIMSVPDTLRFVETEDEKFVELVDGNSSVALDIDTKEATEDTPDSSNPLDKFRREVRELVESSPCSYIPFSKFTATFDKHFNRQCRVADYGYSKLANLLKAVPDVVQLEETDEGAVVCLASGICRLDSRESEESDVVVEESASSDEDNDENISAPAVNRQASCSLMDFDSVPTDDIIRLDSPLPEEACSAVDKESFTILDCPVPDLSTLPLLGGNDTALEMPSDPSDQDLMAELSRGLSDSQSGSDRLLVDPLDKLDVAGARAADVSLIALETPPATTAAKATGFGSLPKHRNSATSLLDEPAPNDLAVALLDASNAVLAQEQANPGAYTADAEKQTTKPTTETTGNSKNSSTRSSIDEDENESTITYDPGKGEGSASFANPLIQSKLFERLGLVATAARIGSNASVAQAVPSESQRKHGSKENVSLEEKLAAMMSNNADLLMSQQSARPASGESEQVMTTEMEEEPAIVGEESNTGAVGTSAFELDATTESVEVSTDVSVFETQSGADGEAAETKTKTKTNSKVPSARFRLAANFSVAPKSLLSEAQN